MDLHDPIHMSLSNNEVSPYPVILLYCVTNPSNIVDYTRHYINYITIISPLCPHHILAMVGFVAFLPLFLLVVSRLPLDLSWQIPRMVSPLDVAAWILIRHWPHRAQWCTGCLAVWWAEESGAGGFGSDFRRMDRRMGKTYWKIPAIRQFLVKHMGSVTSPNDTKPWPEIYPVLLVGLNRPLLLEILITD